MSETRLRYLELAAQQVGPWKRGRIGKHQTILLALAAMYQVFCDEGYVAAKEIADNNVRPNSADVIKLVKREVE